MRNRRKTPNTRGVERPSGRASIFFPDPVAGVAGGLVIGAYGLVFVTLLLRGQWNPLPDLLSFGLFTGIGLLGAANVVRWVGQVPASPQIELDGGYALIVWAWGYLLLAHSTPLSHTEGVVYSITAVAATAALLDSCRSRYLLTRTATYPTRWILGPGVALALWAVLEMGALPQGADWLAIVALLVGLALVVRYTRPRRAR